MSTSEERDEARRHWKPPSVECACGCGQVVVNPKPTQRFYSDACRAAGWRREHLTLRCPHCKKPVHAILLVDDVGRSNGQPQEADHECD